LTLVEAERPGTIVDDHEDQTAMALSGVVDHRIHKRRTDAMATVFGRYEQPCQLHNIAISWSTFGGCDVANDLVSLVGDERDE
jgi:hypothetical protein